MTSRTFTRTVDITDIGKLTESFGAFKDNFVEERARVIQLALRTTVEGDIKKLTPMSNTKRYKMRKTKDGNLVPRSKPPQNVGLQNLRKGFIIRMVRNTGDEVAVDIGYRGIPYAAYVHDNEKTTHYWDKTKYPGTGWSTQRTGNKFVETPVLANATKIINAAMREMDDILERSGL